MEVEDPLSAKFRALIEGLMVSTTSEIVKIFSKVLLETRVEITRSWREIDLLKKHLEECEQQKTEAIFRAQQSDFKREDDEMEVSRGHSQLGVQSANTVRPGDVGPEGRAENVSVGNRGVSLGNAKASGPESTRSSKPDTTPGSACKRSAESTMVNVPETSKTQLSPQSVAESPDSRPGTMSDSSVGQSSVRKVYAVMSAASCQIQISEDANEPTAHETEQVTDDGKHPSASDESGLCTPPRKRKMADCSHDAYNGVFPVENILRWRNNKGRNEVRVKWMPCTLCGAKFQNTWEPAESFPGYLDDKNEEPKKN